MFVLLARLVERFGDDGLGADVRDGGGHARHAADHVRRDAQQPPAGGGVCGRGALRWRSASGATASGGCATSPRPGCFAAFTAANELPALAFFAALAAALLWKAPRQTLLAFLPAALLVAAAFFGTNKIAHDRWSPPYAQRERPNAEDNWYEYEYYVETAKGPKLIPSYWYPEEKVGVDRGEDILLGVRLSRAGRPSWHLLAHADLAAERGGRVADVPPQAWWRAPTQHGAWGARSETASRPS